MKPLALLVLVLPVLILGCQPKHTTLYPDIETNTETPILDISEIRDTSSVEIGSRNRPWRIIPLETHKSAFIGDGNNAIYPGDRFILIETEQRLLQFDSLGKFIRELMVRGRGPQEYLSLSPSVIFRNDFVYFDNSKNLNRGYRCNLESASFSDFPLAIGGMVQDVCIMEDSTLLIINYTFDKDDGHCFLFHQDFRGTLLFSKELAHMNRNSMLGSYQIHPVSASEVIISNPKSDTIISFRKHLSKTILLIEDLKDFNKYEPAEKFVQASFLYSSGNELFLRKQIWSSRNKAIRKISKDLIGFNTETKRTRIINSYYLKEYGLDIFVDDIHFENKTIAAAEYSAFDFKEKVAQILSKSSLDPESRIRLLNLDGRIREGDNPVLIIWDL